MIELQRTGFCKGCPYMDLEVKNLYGHGEIIDTEIMCKHVSICSRIWGFVVEKERELQGVSK